MQCAVPCALRRRPPFLSPHLQGPPRQNCGRVLPRSGEDDNQYRKFAELVRSGMCSMTGVCVEYAKEQLSAMRIVFFVHTGPEDPIPATPGSLLVLPPKKMVSSSWRPSLHPHQFVFARAIADTSAEDSVEDSRNCTQNCRCYAPGARRKI